MEILNLAPNVGGIRQLAELMKRFAVEQSLDSGAANQVEPRRLDGEFRDVLRYVADPIQSLRTPQFLRADFGTTGSITGSCADLATLAAAALYRNARVKHLTFVISRQPADAFQWHAFLTVEEIDGTTYRIDPTAPIDADYTTAEVLEFPIR